MKKNIVASVISLMLCATSFPVAAAQPLHRPRQESIPAPMETALSFAREYQLIEEASQTLTEWDEAMAQKKEEGLSSPLTREDLSDADIEEIDGSVFFIGKSSAFQKVKSAPDAFDLLYQALPLLGGSEKTDMRLWSRQQVNDLTVYSFQQVLEGTEECGSTVKMAVNEKGKVLAIFSSLDEEALKEAEESTQVLATQEEAEQAVRAELATQGFEGITLLPEKTQRVIHTPVSLDMIRLDVEDNGPVPAELRWVVYAEGSDFTDESGSYSYLANYVDLSGNFLYSLPVPQIGDAQSRNGFRGKDLFEGMTPATWSGQIEKLTGGTHTITVPVMFEEETGKYYLGDCERRIAIVDYAAAAYTDDHSLELLGSETNEDWDAGDLEMFYNYIRAWDFYEERGFDGPDGEGNDVIILRNLCMPDGRLYPNASSLGKVANWDMFGYTPTIDDVPFGFPRCLDVMAHEYTHTFTYTMMNNNFYENDQGAINEAMSDIMGNLVEHFYEDSDDAEWNLGETCGEIIRCMNDPGQCDQPAFIWDLYYGPNTDNPNSANDQGGVHVNSSLLNRIAAKLCTQYGMTNDEAVCLWMTVSAGLTPNTDYKRLPVLLKWSLEVSGNRKYADGLAALIEEGKLGSDALPERIPYDQKLLKLTLPDTEAFENDNWVLLGFQPNIEKLENLAFALISFGYHVITSPNEVPRMRSALEKVVENMHLEDSRLKLDFPEDDMEEVGFLTILGSLIQATPGPLLHQFMAWRGAGQDDITLICKDFPMFFILLNITDNGMTCNHASILLGDTWITLPGAAGLMSGKEPLEEEFDPEALIDELVPVFLDIYESFTSSDPGETLKERAVESVVDKGEKIADLVLDGIDFVDYLLSDGKRDASSLRFLTKEAKAEYLSSKGLERIVLPEETKEEEGVA